MYDIKIKTKEGTYEVDVEDLDAVVAVLNNIDGTPEEVELKQKKEEDSNE